jgi:putative flippase GtrA
MRTSILTVFTPTKRLMKFAGVGGLATLVHSSLYIFYLNIVGLDDQLSNFTGFLFALLVSYFGQRHWTFCDIEIESEIQSKLKFLVSSLLSLALNALWVYLTVEVLSQPPEYAVSGIMFITPVIIFLLLKFWVFV